MWQGKSKNNNEGGELQQRRWFVAEHCVVCQVISLEINGGNENGIGFIPCGHVCICNHCYTRYKEKIDQQGTPCYLCRSRITQIVTFGQ